MSGEMLCTWGTKCDRPATIVMAQVDSTNGLDHTLADHLRRHGRAYCRTCADLMAGCYTSPDPDGVIYGVISGPLALLPNARRVRT